MKRNLDWIRGQFVPMNTDYDFKFRYFEDGDFGSLNQVEFDSERFGGAIDFWGMDWLGIFVWDKVKEEERMNIMLSPEQKVEKEDVFDVLQEILKSR